MDTGVASLIDSAATLDLSVLEVDGDAGLRWTPPSKRKLDGESMLSVSPPKRHQFESGSRASSRRGSTAFRSAMRTYSRCAQITDVAGKAFDHVNVRSCRAGDLLSLGHGTKPGVTKGRVSKFAPPRGRRHSQAWTCNGTLQFAFGRLGSIETDRFACGSLGRQTHSSLCAMAAVNSYALHRQDENKKAFLIRAQVQDECVWIHKQTAHDETPMTLNFGGLQQQLMPIAKYWVWEGATNSWRSLTWDEYKQHRPLAQGSTKKPLGEGRTKMMASKGSLQVLACNATLTTCTIARQPSHQPHALRRNDCGRGHACTIARQPSHQSQVGTLPLIFPCTVMPTNNASCICESMQRPILWPPPFSHALVGGTSLL